MASMFRLCDLAISDYSSCRYSTAAIVQLHGGVQRIGHTALAIVQPQLLDSIGLQAYRHDSSMLQAYEDEPLTKLPQSEHLWLPWQMSCMFSAIHNLDCARNEGTAHMSALS